MRNYDNEAYAAGRLVGTFVRTVTGKAIEVRAIGGGDVAVRELLTGNDVGFEHFCRLWRPSWGRGAGRRDGHYSGGYQC